MLEIDATPAQDFAPDRELPFWRALLDGTSNNENSIQVETIDFRSGFAVDPGGFSGSRPFPNPPIEDFALKAEATIASSQQGVWTFNLRSDDGARLIIDDEIVVERNGVNPVGDLSGTIYLSSEIHTIEVLYFNNGQSDAMIELSASRGDGTEAPFHLLGATASGVPSSQILNVNNFEVRQRYHREIQMRPNPLPNIIRDLTSVDSAEALMRAPYHNIIDYFAENSYGNLLLDLADAGDQVDGDGIVGPYTCAPPCHVAEVKRREAMRLADQDFNFAVYDNDGDQILDRDELVVVVVTGQPNVPGQPCGNARRTFVVDAQGNPLPDLVLDQMTVQRRGFWVSAVSQECNWNTFVEEISHLISDEFRDIYHLTGTNLARFDPIAMSDSRVATHFNPWTKMQLGWISPRTVVTGGNYSLQAIEQAPDILRIDHPGRSEEYLLIENRWPYGNYDEAAWQTDFPGQPVNVPEFRPGARIQKEGIIIYHIDENRLDEFENEDFSEPPFIRRLLIPVHQDASKPLYLCGHVWNDLTPNDIGITAVVPRADSKITLDIEFLQSSGILGDVQDRDHFSSDPSLAKPLALGIQYGLSIHSKCDRDYFKFSIGDTSVLSISATGYSDPHYENVIDSPDLKLTSDDYIFAKTPGNTSISEAPPADYVLEVSSNSPLYYKLLVTATPSMIAPDKYDDLIPLGEPRNDTRPDSAQIDLDLTSAQPVLDLQLPWAVSQGGRSVSVLEQNLNFDRSTDRDWYRISVGLSSFPYSNVVGGECPSDLGEGLTGFERYSSRGALRVAVRTPYPWQLDMGLYDVNGTSLTGQPFVDLWHGDWYSGIQIDCPTDNLASWPDASGRGVIFVEVADPIQHRGSYDFYVKYQESGLFAIYRDQFPHEIWELSDIEVLWPLPEPTHLTYPIDLHTCDGSLCAGQIDKIGIAWPEPGDFNLFVSVKGHKSLSTTLYGPTGPIGEQMHIKGEAILKYTMLPQGVYILAVEAEQAPIDYSFSFQGH